MDLHAILVTVIAFSAVLTVLITILTFIFTCLLNPVKENQSRMEKRMDGIESRMDKIESRMCGIETKLDKLIAKTA